MTIGENGVITKSQESKFKTDMSSYNETVKMYTSSKIMENKSVSEVNSFLDKDKDYLELDEEINNISITTIITNFSNEYLDKIIVIQGVMYYKIPEGKLKNTTIKREVKWCKEIGIPIYGEDVISLYEEYDDVTIPSSSTWDETAGHYTPDISKFNKRNTYYIDNTGNVVGRIDRISAPDNWYNYSNKEWANVVTVNGSLVSYWVWIPRYEYKVKKNEQGTALQKMDIQFITTEKTNSGTTTDTQADEGYEIPESFTFGGKELTGYWLSKYELSNTNSKMFTVGLTSEEAIIQPIAPLVADTEYTIFVDGLNVGKSVLPYSVKNLTKDVYHTIMVVGTDGVPIGQNDACLVESLIEKPDISKFNKKNTYYVDATGKITGRVDTTEAPSNWYNYNNKEWANIVTINDNIVSYWVWIPRYEYKLSAGSQNVDVKFIKKRQKKADPEYEIPESFQFGGKELGGYWLSKYELSLYNDTNPKRLQTELRDNSILVKAFSAEDTNRYRIFVDGVEYKGNPEEESHTLPYEIQGLGTGKEYDILIVDAQTGVPVLEKTIQRNMTNIEAPDLTGFNNACTYYVTWDAEGNETKTPITNAVPQNWYNYEKKEWANIVTTSTETDENKKVYAYWVWIPRYEYKLYNQTGKTEIKFIPKTQTTPDEGYEIPESFTFGGKQLGGYWLSKYELSNK